MTVPAIALGEWKHILNESFDWVEKTVPHFICSDADITTTYWYRWRLFHLHMRRGTRGGACPAEGCWVLTEFLRKVFWSGPYNTIVAPAGHHIMEGRWIHDKVTPATRRRDATGGSPHPPAPTAILSVGARARHCLRAASTGRRRRLRALLVQGRRLSEAVHLLAGARALAARAAQWRLARRARGAL